MPRARIAAASITAAFVGCAPTAETAPPDPATEPTNQPSPTIVTSSTVHGNETTSTSEPPTSAAIAEPDRPGTTAAAVSGEMPAGVAVSALGLPLEITSAIASGGGELATTDAWQRRFGEVGLPVLAGSEVRLVEAELEAIRTDGGWQRVDALQWLFASATDAPVDEYLDELAAVAGINSIDPIIDSETVEGAECISRTYDAPPAGWVLQGCAFPQFDQVRSVGVMRTTPDGSPPRDVHPSVGGVVGALGGEVDSVVVTFGSPAPSSTSTLVVTVEVSSAADAADAAPALADGALAGWRKEPGEAGSVLFAGAPGETWMVFGDRARFTSEGRLDP